MSCLSPYYVSNPLFPVRSNREKVPVPCGKCPPCLTRRTSGWVFRLLQQEKISESSVFLTLTYDTDHVNISEKGYMTLCKKDYQDFMKRLRKHHKLVGNSSKLSYYACGEYGSKNWRPHFHAIIFNCDKELISKSWDKGQIYVDKVTGASIAYTCKYMNKGKLIPVHQNDDRVPEFSLMSKKMGMNYLSDEIVRYHKADLSRAYVNNGDVKVAMPRYYREKIYTKGEREAQGKIVEQLQVDNEGRRLQSYIDRTGSSDGYDRATFESQKAQYESFKKKAVDNRKL